MKRLGWQTVLGLGLIVLSAVLYALHYLIFRDAHHIFIYMLGDVAFVPIEVLLVTSGWSDRLFDDVWKNLRTYTYKVDMSRLNLYELRDYLTSRRDFLIRLLENPLLLDNESFTGLLRAVFHLTEELQARPDFKTLPESDIEHLAGDVHRVYYNLVMQWLLYMRYLKNVHPYLFSLALRTNPFDRAAVPVVT